MVWQFVPIIRHNFILFHRINGYTVTTLLTAGTVSALVITRRAFGGTTATQVAIGLLAILVLGSLGMAIYNIRRMQVDQHRGRMLQVVFYCGAIIKTRLSIIISAQIFALDGGYYTTFSWNELTSAMGPKQLYGAYPQSSLQNGTTTGYVAVEPPNFSTNITTVATTLQLGFSKGLRSFRPVHSHPTQDSNMTRSYGLRYHACD